MNHFERSFSKMKLLNFFEKWYIGCLFTLKSHNQFFSDSMNKYDFKIMNIKLFYCFIIK